MQTGTYSKLQPRARPFYEDCGLLSIAGLIEAFHRLQGHAVHPAKGGLPRVVRRRRRKITLSTRKALHAD